MRKYILFLIFLCLHCIARGQTGFDYRYWFDNDNSAIYHGHSTSGEWQMEVNVEGLSESFHTIHLQVVDSKGTESVPVSRTFVKIPQTDGVEFLKCLCFVDEQLYKTEDVSSTGGIINWDLDVNSLSQGFHRMQVQVITSNGIASSAYNACFLRTTTNEEMAEMKCFYTIDDDEFNTEAGHMSNGAYHFDLDVAHLSDGLHRITYMLTNGKGVETKVQTQFFMKTPVGGNGITEYWYWLNDSTSQAHKVQLDKRTNPFELISLLPVEKHPIRSSQFQFEVTDGQPTIYAKNDFHIRFYDVTGRFVDATEQFVDYQMKQEVTDLTLINNGDHQTIETPGKDTIHWFKFYAEEGDTVTFRTDQASTLQVFSPEGKELYSASGSASVVYGGCHTWTNGNHYVALHDVTGSKPNISLDYFHMDKYDVASQDIHIVGNGGCSTITFDGNGFRDLYAVDLFTAQGDSIGHIAIGHESDAQTSVIFDFSNAAIGVYDAVFHFATEDKVFSHIVTVEEAKDIELATTVIYPSTFLRGTSTTYTIKLTNKGNMTAYYVPLELKLIVNSIKDVSEIHFDGYLKPSKLSDILSKDSLEEETINMIKEIEKEVSDLSQFVIYQDSLSNIDYGLCQIILSLPPNSTKTFTVTIKSASTVSLEAYMTSEWFPLTSYSNNANSRKFVMKASKRDWMCCQRERFECVADVVVSIAGVFMPPGAGCATSLALTGLETAYDVWCSDGESASEKWNNYLQSQGQSLANRLIQSAVSCVTAYFHIQKNKLKEDRILAAQLGSSTEVKRINAEIQALRTMESSMIRNIYDGLCTFILGDSCLKAFKENKPNCPPNPDGGGGSSKPVNSYDPNEIYGYLSDAGSYYMTDSVEKINYRIEFENDTVFATASAMAVQIRDTLDSHHFDLPTYAPTGIKIGDKVEYLNGEQNFMKTIDMRPEINGLVEVTGNYDVSKGIMNWQFTSLDPITMEPTTDPMQGFLPVNYNGNGIGEVTYDIALRQPLAEGTEVQNRASIVFDINAPILTPTWINVIDATAPTSRAIDVTLASDTTATVSIQATDNLSGVWRYDVYVQYGAGAAWWKAAENVPADLMAMVKIYDGIDHGFYVVATDSAGNVERKQAMRELTLNLSSTIRGDVNGDGQVGIADIVAVTDYMAESNGNVSFAAADLNGDGQIGIADIIAITDIIAGTTNAKANQPMRYKTYFTRNKLR